ncbi:hypothetical protein AMTRI_Chr13g119020 [Amborella trichopoda]
MGHSCLILAGKYFTEGYFPQRVLHQFRYIQHYTSLGEAIDRCPIFLLRRHSSTLLVKAGLSWKGKKSSSREEVLKQDKSAITSNYDSWWERAYPLSLCPKVSRLHDESSAPLRISCLLENMAPLVQINESNTMRMCLASAWKRLKLNWPDGWPSWQNSRRRMLIRSRRLNSQIFLFSLLFSLA